MSTTLCPVCNCDPCVAICPMVDPYAGRQDLEHADYVAGCDPYDGWGDVDHCDDPGESEEWTAWLTQVGGVAANLCGFQRWTPDQIATEAVRPAFVGSDEDIPF